MLFTDDDSYLTDYDNPWKIFLTIGRGGGRGHGVLVDSSVLRLLLLLVTKALPVTKIGRWDRQTN